MQYKSCYCVYLTVPFTFYISNIVYDKHSSCSLFQYWQTVALFFLPKRLTAPLWIFFLRVALLSRFSFECLFVFVLLPLQLPCLQACMLRRFVSYFKFLTTYFFRKFRCGSFWRKNFVCSVLCNNFDKT